MDNSNICKFNLNRSSDLVCSNFVYEKDNSQSQISRADQYVANLVIKGSGSFVCEGKTYALVPGTLFFVCKGDRFSIYGPEKLGYSYICFDGRRASEYIERLDISPTNCIFEGLEMLIPFWRESLENTDEGNIDLMSEAVLLYSLAQLKPKGKEQSDIISKIVRITGEQFTDPDLSLSVIASQVGYHTKYISFLFKKQKGIAYTQYLRDLRIKHAIFLMEQGIVSVKNVAILSGFGDALYFSKIFKQVEGISPKDYIKKVAERSEAE